MLNCGSCHCEGDLDLHISDRAILPDSHTFDPVGFKGKYIVHSNPDRTVRIHFCGLKFRTSCPPAPGTIQVIQTRQSLSSQKNISSLSFISDFNKNVTNTRSLVILLQDPAEHYFCIPAGRECFLAWFFDQGSYWEGNKDCCLQQKSQSSSSLQQADFTTFHFRLGNRLYKGEAAQCVK